MHISEIGQGQVVSDDVAYRLTVPQADDRSYHNAQVSDYINRHDFKHSAGVRLSLRAHVEGGSLHGTAGFGFWNHPFAPNERGFRFPKACWFFFGSPPNDMALAKGVPGHGWKAATFDATGWPFYALLPTAPIAFLLMRIPALYDRLWPVGQRAIGVSEYALDKAMLYEPHDYVIDWCEGGVTFLVDGLTVHQSPHSPRSKLGFVAWVDNQYAVVTPKGRFKFGLVDVPAEQSLVVKQIRIEKPT